MRTIDKKLARDLWALRGQGVAIAAVIACGITTLVALAGVYDAIRLTRNTYYAEYAFADVFTALTRAPESISGSLRLIPGVAEVETRVVVPVTLDIPGRSDVITGRIVSIPDSGNAHLNRLFLRSGRLPADAAPGEILVSEAFADANGVRPGDRIGIVVNGRLQRPRVTGIAISPEYVYEVGPGEIWPNSRAFGVLWMRHRPLAAAFDMTGSFNDAAFRLASTAQLADVVGRIDRILEPYGGAGAYGRHDQVSDFVVVSKIQQLRAQAVFMPAIFLGIATFLSSMLLSRLVRTDRMQIGTLKAFGYSGARIARHYLTLALAIVAAGCVLGVASGIWLGEGLAAIYVRYFHFPILHYDVSPSLVTIAVLVSAAAGLGGAFGAARAAAALPPAEAMSPEAPAHYRRALADRLGIARRLPSAFRMIFRNLERRPLTSGTTALGIALATALLVVGMGALDSTTRMLALQFGAIEREDVALVFDHERDRRALLEVRRLPGVLRAEPFRSVAVRLRAGQHSYRMGLTGVNRGQDLRRVFDTNGAPVALPPRGLLLNSTVAGILHVRPGDRVEVEALEGPRHRFGVPVTELVDEPLGVSGTMELDDLDRRLGEGATISGVRLAVDALKVPQLDADFKRTPEIAGVAYRKAEVENARTTFNDSIVALDVFLLVLSIVLTFGVVYNAARIALSERSRELATLRIIGLTRGEVATVLLGEQALLTAVAIPLGLALGNALLLWLINTAFRTELYRVPYAVTALTWVVSALAVAAAAVISGAIVRRRIQYLDMIAVLKGE